MTSPRLVILNMPHTRDWEPYRHTPRFLLPLEFSTTPCASCAGSCCALTVPLTTVEALRIAVTLQLPFWGVVSAVPPSIAGKDFWATPPIPLKDGTMTLALRRKDMSCVFLHGVAGVARCSIHALRPGTCRAYPFDVLHDGARITGGSQSLCPVKWLRADGTEDAVLRDVDAWHADIAREHQLLEAWAAADIPDRTRDAYLRFAAEHLADFLGTTVEAMFPPARRTLGRRLW